MSFNGPDYIAIPFNTDANQLADGAIAELQAQWPDWQPEDGDPEVVLIEAIAPMAADAAGYAALMPPAALIAYGTKVLGIDYETGARAEALATFTVQDANGPYVIDGGSEVDLGGVAFQTIADLTVPNGSTTGSVVIVASSAGVIGNGLDGSDWASGNLPVYVTGLALAAPTDGGIDPQDDNDYLNMVSREMRLRARSIITLPDMEIAAVNIQGIGRAVAVADESRPRDIVVFVTNDTDGNPATSIVKSAVADKYADTRLVNANFSVSDATYDTVSVAYEALALPGVDPVALEAIINANLALLLSPTGWGNPSSTNPGLSWIDQPVVAINRIMAAISRVAGVDMVVSVALSATTIATLSGALSTGAPITAIPVNALVNAIASGETVTVNDGAGHTQTWHLTSAANVGDTHLAVTSQTPNFAYPSGTPVGGAVSGDLTMNGGAAGPLPKPGTFTGTIDVPAT